MTAPVALVFCLARAALAAMGRPIAHAVCWANGSRRPWRWNRTIRICCSRGRAGAGGRVSGSRRRSWSSRSRCSVFHRQRVRVSCAANVNTPRSSVTRNTCIPTWFPSAVVVLWQCLWRESTPVPRLCQVFLPRPAVSPKNSDIQAPCFALCSAHTASDGGP